MATRAPAKKAAPAKSARKVPAKKRGVRYTTIYGWLVKAGDRGLTRDQVAKKLGGLQTHKSVASRALNTLAKQRGAVERDGRWHAIDGWEYRDGPPKILHKLPAPEIGVDLTQEEYDAEMAKLGRPKRVVDIDPELLAFMTEEERQKYRLYQAHHHEDDWETWLTAMFAPTFIKAPFGPHHRRFWDHISTIRAGKRARPFIAVWNRGSAKSTSAEMAAAMLGALGRRRYVLYVSATQLAADEHVTTIGEMLTGELMEMAYPDVANPATGMHGQTRGWRRNRLIAANGFVVDALGLDVNARGRRVKDQRPDLIIIDDIDDQDDTPATIRKKIKQITRKILPMGSQDCIVLGVQNLIHPESIFARLVSKGGMGEPERATFLATRIVSGPIKAVEHLTYQQEITKDEDGDELVRWVITGGTPTWAGMDLESCQAMIDEFGLEAFLAECQHEEPDYAGTMFGHLDFSADAQSGLRVNEAEFERIGVKKHRVYGEMTCVWCDPAVTATDKSDSCGIVCDSLGRDGRVYRRFAWERIATPTEVIKQAIRTALTFNAAVVGIETDQGGVTWDDLYRRILPEVVDEWRATVGPIQRVPRFEWHKAGASNMAKVTRAQQMLVDYDMRRIKHVGGFNVALERGLRRFPEHKPYDVVDAAWHSWKWCQEHGGAPKDRSQKFTARAPRGAVGEISAGALAN